jgi:alpha-beta hydrolase superfamily lysophospholipase
VTRGAGAVPRAAALLAAVLAGACARVPTAAEYRAGTVVSATAPFGPAQGDGRARFREVFCGVLAAGEAACEHWLWRLADEPRPAGPPAPLPGRPALRAFVVTGAFSDCFDEYALAYWTAARVLAARGYAIEVLPVSGRSSVAHNARQIESLLAARGVRADERIVLVGYSKGALDALEYLVGRPAPAARVAALVSIASPLLGSPAARLARPLYVPFAGAFAAHCDPGDGGVLDSLVPEERRRWLEAHPLPSGVAYFSMAAFTTGDGIARGARASWRLLANYDRWNDGQVAAAAAVIPGATLLGYANADHWNVAVQVEASHPFAGARRDPRPFPREALLEAVLLYVGEALRAEAP